MHTTSFDKYRDIYVSVNGITLTGIAQSPEQAKSVVLFAHGASGTRFSALNRFVADQLTIAGFATVLMDLLTPGERSLAQQRGLKANIALIASRLICTIDWIKRDAALQQLPLGLFGSNTGATAALAVAIERSVDIGAVVLSNAKPDLIKNYLPLVKAPTLLIAGDKDHAQLQWNRETLPALGEQYQAEAISGSTHDTGNKHILEQIAGHTTQWFAKKLS